MTKEQRIEVQALKKKLAQRSRVLAAYVFAVDDMLEAGLIRPSRKPKRLRKQWERC